MITPTIVEVPADYKDIADSAIKFTSIALAQWALRNFILDQPVGFRATFVSNMTVVAGLALFHLVVDKMVVRVVVKPGEESYYAAMSRHR